MMNVYISGPIKGVDDYKERFEKAQKYLEQDEGVKCINPASFNFGGLTEKQIMNIDLTMLEACDAIYMLNGWEASCGANREYGYALAMDKIISHERKVK